MTLPKSKSHHDPLLLKASKEVPPQLRVNSRIQQGLVLWPDYCFLLCPQLLLLLPPSSLCSSTPWTLALQSFPKHTVVSSLIIFTHLVPMPAMLISFGHWPRPHLRPPLLSFSESLSLWFSPKVLPLLSFHLLSLSPQTFSSPYSALFSPWHSLKPFYFCVCLLYALFYIRIVSSQKVTLISSLGEAEGKREELQVSDSLPHFPKSQVSPLFGFFGSSW